MKLIVAVFDDWGIGKDGTQPIALSADRKFFRKTTAGAAVIVGRKTLKDFPGGRPLPKRRNVVLSRSQIVIEGAEVCHSPEEAAELLKDEENVFVIGGGTVYRQMMPYCDAAVVTRIHTLTPCDTFFPNLDMDPAWEMTEILEQGEEEGIAYQMCLYRRKAK
ncbi:MAG: dihydrofolate reductase [Firmicutes bacterium]|nr:dihydrofolate reductase [Bacillota bacterium]